MDVLLCRNYARLCSSYRISPQFANATYFQVNLKKYFRVYDSGKDNPPASAPNFKKGVEGPQVKKKKNKRIKKIVPVSAPPPYSFQVQPSAVYSIFFFYILLELIIPLD